MRDSLKDRGSTMFLSKWPGVCQKPDCGEPFPAGAPIRYDGHHRLVHDDCSAWQEAFDSGRRDYEPAEDSVALQSVLPRNPRPACTRCFMIPAANGTCDC